MYFWIIVHPFQEPHIPARLVGATPPRPLTDTYPPPSSSPTLAAPPPTTKHGYGCLSITVGGLMYPNTFLLPHLGVSFPHTATSSIHLRVLKPDVPPLPRRALPHPWPRPWVAFPWWIYGAVASPWCIRGAWCRSSGVVVSSTQKAMTTHPPSMEAARSTPRWCPQSHVILGCCNSLFWDVVTYVSECCNYWFWDVATSIFLVAVVVFEMLQ